MESKSQKENTERVAEEYLSSLSDLTCNSKPLINMLTMLAEENIEYAAIIVKVVEQHIAKVQPHFKLPILYLIDSIVKNVKSSYVQLFSHCIVGIFCGVFEKVNETVRERMYALRQTWNEVFSPQKLYALDVKVKRIDTNWPITAKQAQPSIHVNPNFLKTVNAAQTIPSDMEEVLHAKTRELLELKKRKLELELEATKKYLEEQEKQLSKATDSVTAPPVEVIVATNTLPPGAIRTQHLPPQVMPGSMVPPQHRMHPGAPPAGIRPAMYNHNFRNPRPQMIAPAGMMNMPPQGYQAMPNAAKAKVHPVNPALLNTVRHRDPRLARQQHQQQQQQQQQMQIIQNRGPMFSVRNASNVPTEVAKAEVKSNYRSSKSSRGSGGGGGSGGSGSESKSPTRNSSSSSNRSAGRSGSSKNSSSSRDKDKERKRSESKSSTTSSSSAGSNSERRKASASLTQREVKPETEAIKCDKDAFEIAPLSSTFKRKSSSPASSPSSRDSKRSSKSRNYPRSNKNRSRSTSPLDTKDVDLRTMPTISSMSSSSSTSPDKRVKLSDSDHEKEDHKPSGSSLTPATSSTAASTSSSSSASKDLDKNLKIVLESPALLLPSLTSSMMDIDLRQFPSSSSTSLSNQLALVVNPAKPTTIQRAKKTIATTTTTTSSPKVSFKIEKLFNKLEKSTENLSTASSSAAVAVADDVKATIDTKTNNNNNVDIKPEDSVSSGGRQLTSRKPSSSGEASMVIDGVDEDGKKRPLMSSASQEEDQPLAKKSKSAKLDALFGSEDVDLRTVMPPQILAVSAQKQSSGIMTPPPPVISSEEESSGQQNVENWDNVKTSPSKVSTKKSSSLEDVRAKLAKTAKYNKFGKFEKTNKELSQRFKLSELNMNDDTQEANDEKIRTIITQAQELLDSNSINQEQYKNLVQTVMSINETNKLKEAKRRESLNNNNTSSKSKQALSDEESSIDAERLAAREAILKKRIPKLAKKDSNKSVDSPLSDGGNNANTDSPRYESNEDSNDAPKAKPPTKEKKRSKSSKWDTANPAHMANNNMNMQRPWMSGKRNAGDSGVGFRGSIPHPPLPPLPNPNLSLQLPWQMRPGMPPPPFANSMSLMQRGNVPPPPQPPMGMPPSVVPAVPAIPKPCNSIDNPQADLVRTITIDGMAKEIRIYDQVAIVFMELDQPREIGFQAGQRSIIIDNQEAISLQFNDEYKPIAIEGEAHRVRFGFPSRELYIDEHWYEIYFGGPPVSIPIKNKIHILKAEGPPPQVNIGPLRRDLVVGKINMIVDAHIIVPLFLDARVQTFRLGDKEHSIQFADNLLTVLMNGEVINVVYGGLPKSLTLGDIKYFIRFGALPHGVVAGKVQIKNMLYMKTEPLPEIKPETSDNKSEMSNTQNVPGIAANVEPKSETEGATKEGLTTAPEGASTSSASATVPTMPAGVLNNMNIDELFQKLVSSGILGGTTKVAAATTSTAASKTTTITTTEPTAAKNSAPEEPPQEPIRPINLNRSETIKSRQAGIVATLFTGMQCSSCGVRFPPEQTIKYSQHLDWHFRQNRRERHSSRKAHSRNWYYDLNDWVQYEEIEDLDEREKNFFESQQNDFESVDDASNQRSTNSPVLSCPAGPDDVDRICDMCQEKFEQFYNEELEEWHLRTAVRIEDKIYHPLCYEDYKASLNPPKPEEDKKKDQELINGEDDNAMDVIIKIEGDEKTEEEEKASMTIVDDEDDDVIVLPNDEPSVTEIDDDEDEYIPLNVTREEMGVVSTEEAKVASSEDGVMNETTESDVEIQEPNIPFTDLDTYEEKELPECDEGSQMSFMNLKIKEEPKEDEDEDDGFEDVGTVVVLPDEEISIQSSEETQTQTIGSSTSVASPSAERPPSAASQHDPTDAAAPETAAIVDLNISMDGNMEPEDEHNLSTAGPAPAIPMASLVNKIKINITKNNVSTNSSSASATTTTTTATTSNSLNCNSNELNRGSLGQQNTIPTVSTIPVMYGGGSTASSIVSHVTTTNNGDGSASGSGANVSSISVIGSYCSGSSSSSTSRYHNQHAPPAAAAPPVARKAPTPPPPIEDTITYEQKPALQKAALKKTKKQECGIETSGLCSIM